MYKTKFVSSLIVALFAIMLIIAIQPTPAKAQFALASWDYPDGYGQGIYWVRLYENTTGSWEEIEGLYEGAIYYNNFTQDIFEWNASVFMLVSVMTALNKTLVGVSTRLEGRNYFQHNVSVIDIGNNLVFSKQNFTYYGQVGTDADPIYYYVYQVILNFLFLNGEYYTVTVFYEVYY